MPLDMDYPEDFERIWKVYPKWGGRSKKKPSYDAFKAAKKRCGFTEKDIEELELRILEQVRCDEGWQKGHKYGPPMFSTYFNQHRWNETYKKVRQPAYRRPIQETAPEVPVDREAQRRAFEDAKRSGMGLH